MILSTLVGLCCCMDGFFNSSGFEAMDEEFGLDFLASGPYGQSDGFCFENIEDTSLMEDILLGIFNEDPSLIVDGEDEGPAPAASREGSTKINYWETKLGQMFLDPDVEKPWTIVGGKFRQRWRMDKVLMDHIIELCRSVNLWDITHPNLVRVPLESLRHRNWYFTTFIHYLYCIVSSTLSYICKHYWKVSLMSIGTKQICRL